MKNTNTNNEFLIYLSYPLDRNNSTTFYAGIKDSINTGIEIRAYLIDWEKMDGLPRSHLYIPAEHELFTQTAYKNKFLTSTQILATNYDIIKHYADLIVLFGDYNPRYENIVAEIGAAKKAQVPIYTMPNLSDNAIDALRFTIKVILHMEGDDE